VPNLGVVAVAAGIQTPASFNLDDIMKKLESAGGSGR